MFRHFRRLIVPDRKSDTGLILRAWSESGRAHWKSYVAVTAFMGVAAGATAIFAYGIAHVVNVIYFRGSFSEVATLALATIALFCAKGFATYGQGVMLARVGNRITAENQQRMFNKLVREGM